MATREHILTMTKLRTLYLDMNSFFASVEQQVEPHLRGRPVGITAVEAESGCVVAASYEAKAAGVKTGHRVFEARRLCPGIVFRPSRHRLYVRFNQRIAAVIDEIAELEHVRSVDEFQIALGGRTADLDGALDLGLRLKQAIRAQVGSELRSSVGVGPNPLLAKIAAGLEKPDGLTWLAPENMPGRIAHLGLTDLPGISRGIVHRLLRAQIRDVTALHALDPRHARMIWGSVQGERFVRALQGMNIQLEPTKRSGYGNSKVLAPRYRTLNKAYLVGRWLTEKAAERMRRDEYCTRMIGLSCRFLPEGGWGRTMKVTATQDTRVVLDVYEALWASMTARCAPSAAVGSVSVHLGDVLPLRERPGELFLPLEAGRQNRSEKLASVVDHLNRRYGRRVVTFGLQQDHPGFFDRG